MSVATLANENAAQTQGFEDASMAHVEDREQRDRLDSEAIDYKMADINLEDSKESPNNIDSDSQQQESAEPAGKENSFNDLIAKYETTATGFKK